MVKGRENTNFLRRRLQSVSNLEPDLFGKHSIDDAERSAFIREESDKEPAWAQYAICFLNKEIRPLQMFSDKTGSYHVYRSISNRNVLRHIANPTILNVLIQCQLTRGDINSNDLGVVALRHKCTRSSTAYVNNYRSWPGVRAHDLWILTRDVSVIVGKLLS